MGDPLYRLRGVIKEYGTRCVIQIDELEIQRGEILAIVGPSGAGKSTLLRLLNFLEVPTSGSITYLNHEYGNDQKIPLSQKRSITTVFQRPTLLRRSVYANVSYGLRLRGERNAAEQIQSALERVGLTGLAHQSARTLSGGEAQRVALARAMVIQPQSLLLDEPTANLDPYNINLIESIVTDLNREQSVTVVLVTHNIFQARRIAHRVALMLDGEIVEMDATERFFNSPRDPRTAAFVRGEMVY